MGPTFGRPPSLTVLSDDLMVRNGREVEWHDPSGPQKSSLGVAEHPNRDRRSETDTLPGLHHTQRLTGSLRLARSWGGEFAESALASLVLRLTLDVAALRRLLSRSLSPVTVALRCPLLQGARAASEPSE